MKAMPELAISKRNCLVDQDKLQGVHCLLSIIIKALNEERNIALGIESALAAVDGLDAEVILADSSSTDRTVEIARQYPIKIVTLNNREDRSCGVGAVWLSVQQGKVSLPYRRGHATAARVLVRCY
jgi:cellulose synthase/poly-beta-1,6-N-acetylglucosamine synthase-like glycosyltransferase